MGRRGQAGRDARAPRVRDAPHAPRGADALTDLPPRLTDDGRTALRLRPLRAGDEPDARAAHDELARDGFEFLLGWQPDEPWSAYLHRLEQLHRGLDVPPDRVPATFLVAQVGAELVGRVSIRHELNDDLRNFGGHIGYGVRPGRRRRGYAAEILRQALVIARAQGVDPVLVTCDQHNVHSAAVIERAGGALEDVRPAPDGASMRRYWIT